MVVELDVGRMVQGGDGIAELAGLKVFVRYGAPGDRIRARIVTRKRHYAVAEIVEVVQPSPLRTTPECPHFGVCGGCQLQHIRHDGQLAAKTESLRETLRRLGRVTASVNNAAGGQAAWRYRNKTQYPVIGGVTPRIGFYRRDSHDLVDTAECRLHPLEFDRVRAAVLEAMAVSGESGYTEASDTGSIRHLVVRQSEPERGLLVIAVTRTHDLSQRFIAELAARVPLLGMVQCIQPARTNRILSSRLLVRTGVGAISQSLLGRTFRVSAASFFQVNSAQAAELCRQVIEYAEPQPGDTVLDLYSGVGLFTLTIAPSVRQVKGIEVDRGAVEDARANAQSQGQDNVEFVCGDVDRAITSPIRADIVLLDPPRKGCAPETLDHVAGLRARRIVYVSCNPATLARDLARLHQLGYETRAVTAIDMFPQTFHIEAVAALAPRGA